LEPILQRRIHIPSLRAEDVAYFFQCDVVGSIMHSFDRISFAGARPDHLYIHFLVYTCGTGSARCSVTFANSSTKLPANHSIPVATV
jgi:hypothetical protein